MRLSGLCKMTLQRLYANNIVMERDVRLDCYRSLTMMYIVCIMHPILWYSIDIFGFDPTMFIDMPVIFFIAGASQTFTQRRNIIDTIKNRAQRVLLPYYIFIVIALLLMTIATLFDISFEGNYLDIRNIGIIGIAKILLTGGSDSIPYFGYTWFISTYMIISCSLPIQQRIMDRISYRWYMLILIIVFALWKATKIISPETIIENVLSYNIFYILGYVAYKKIRHGYIIAIISTIVWIYLIYSGIATPFGEHKFPSDIIFVIYSLSSLVVISFVVSRISIKYNHILRIWNERGYTIYLYQSVTHFIVYKIIGRIQILSDNDILLFIISAIMVFILATALSHITILPEKYILNKISKR